MNTSFNILWFEDELTWFNMEKMRVENILKSHYLVPCIIRKDGENFDINELVSNDYDMILMDFKLADEITGDIIVSALRENNVLTDILFYSSDEDTMLAAISANMPPIDGVYLTKRDHKIFTEKVERLIGKIVKRSEDVVNLRGFVLDNTSDFELRIKEILNVCWQKFDEVQREILLNATLQLFENKRNRISQQINAAISSDSVFEYANNDKYMLSISDRLDLLQTILPILSTTYNLPNNQCPKNFKEYYNNSITVYRNCLSHVQFGEKTICVRGKDIPIDQNLHRLLRKNIADVNDTINRLEIYITTSI